MVLSRDSRPLAATAALGLFVSLFLPWSQETVIARGVTGLRTLTVTRSGWQAFGLVEIVVLLAAVAVWALLGVRRLRRDGVVVCAAGALCCALIVARLFSGPGTSGHGVNVRTTSDVRWGMFVALAFSAALAYLGTRIPARAAPSRTRRPRRPRPAASVAAVQAPVANARARATPAPAPPAPAPPAPAAPRPVRRRPRSLTVDRLDHID